jgi:hypothetical protein
MMEPQRIIAELLPQSRNIRDSETFPLAFFALSGAVESHLGRKVGGTSSTDGARRPLNH